MNQHPLAFVHFVLLHDGFIKAILVGVVCGSVNLVNVRGKDIGAHRK